MESRRRQARGWIGKKRVAGETGAVWRHNLGGIMDAGENVRGSVLAGDVYGGCGDDESGGDAGASYCRSALAVGYWIFLFKPKI
jgi:hypothetical protein